LEPSRPYGIVLKYEFEKLVEPYKVVFSHFALGIGKRGLQREDRMLRKLTKLLANKKRDKWFIELRTRRNKVLSRLKWNSVASKPSTKESGVSDTEKLNTIQP
jgi:hypothetical protein